MAEGDQTTQTTETSWTSSLPEPIRGHEAWKEVPDVPTLATKYLETRKPFADQLPEDIKADAVFRDIKNLDGLARSYKGQAHLLGVPKDQLLKLPVDLTDETEMGPIYERLGRPAKPEEYKLSAIEGVPAPEEKFAKPVFEAAHKLGMTAKQMDGIYGVLAGMAKQQQADAKAASDAVMAQNAAALKTEWGAAHDQKMREAIFATEQLEAKFPGLKAELDATKLGNLPALAKVFQMFGANLKEDGHVDGRATGGDTLSSPTEAKQQIAALQADKRFQEAYQNRNHVGHAEAMRKMSALFEQAYPEGQAA